MRSLVPSLAVLGAVALLLFVVSGPRPEHHVVATVTADEFANAIETHRTSLIDYYFHESLDPNARGKYGTPLTLIAAERSDWNTVHRLVDAGASVDLADDGNFTPVMAAAAQGRVDMLRELVGRATNLNTSDQAGRSALQYAIIAGNHEAVDLLLTVQPVLEDRRGDLLEAALASGNPAIVKAIAERLPIMREWTPGTRHALRAAIGSGDRDLVRMLLQKHAVPPTPEGKNVPLLAYAIASHDPNLFNTLLGCGADPNTTLPSRYDEDFLGILPKKFRNYIEDDKNVTVLMVAAGLGQPDAVQALLDAGADRKRSTARYKMLALYLAAETGQWRCTQILLGSGPAPEQLHIEISLASQHVSLVKDGVSIFTTSCSTGRPGYATHSGDYVITDKERNHRSTIYHVDMPYFMRLSCLDFGMHEGVVPNYPASHGCIRLPGEAARRLFAEIPIGTLVTVK
jgi:ankyrin repeat protein